MPGDRRAGRRTAMNSRMRRSITATLTASVVIAFLALTASASALVEAYDEPAYTKTNGNNAYWFHWTAVNGTAGGVTDYRYYLCLFTYHNGTLEESSNGSNGPGSPGCTNSLRSGPSPASGDEGFKPYAAATV